jgi:tetratricopeptide (TPR) repeat protein
MKSAGDARAALASLERALRAKPATELAGRIRVLQGDCLTAEGRTAEALRAYEQGGSERTLQAAAATALNQGDTEEAVRIAERAASASPSSSSRLLLGEAPPPIVSHAEYAFGAVSPDEGPRGGRPGALQAGLVPLPSQDPARADAARRACSSRTRLPPRPRSVRGSPRSAGTSPGALILGKSNRTLQDGGVVD